MSNSFAQKFKKLFGSWSELFLVLSILGILIALFTPIPGWLLDFLLIANISFAISILLISLFSEKPLDFSTFPTLLLIATLFRLALNIGATRLILSDGDAGEVIGAVGEYVVGGNFIIGLVVFFILIVVQYIVVTNGAQRVAEVAARFTLDSMPGKQMSIDADMNMGLIDEHEAKSRRKEIEREANFYGAMDGASKFVKGDAIAGIIIILIDIIGGLTVGIAQLGLSWGDALQQYTLLTVGDGIVTQIPALIIATATGIIVTRAATDADFGEEITRQITRYPKTLVIVAVGLFFMLIMPGIPILPVLVILIGVSAAAFYAYKLAGDSEDETTDSGKSDDKSSEQNLYEKLEVSPIEITLASNINIIIGEENNLFTKKLDQFREQLAYELGIVIPSVRIFVDDSILESNYIIKIHGSKVASDKIYTDKVLAISTNSNKIGLEGIETTDPSYGLPAIWIDKEKSSFASTNDYTIVDSLTVLVTHFSESIRRHLPEILTRTEVDQLLNRVKIKQPALYEELIPNILAITDIQKVLQRLLSENISIRQIDLILDALLDTGRLTKDIEVLGESVRKKIGRIICTPLVTNENELKVLSFSADLEKILHGALSISEADSHLILNPSTTEKILKLIAVQAEKMLSEGIKPTLICSSGLRRHIRKITGRVIPHLSVLALDEIPSTLSISSYTVIKMAVNQTELKLRENYA